MIISPVTRRTCRRQDLTFDFSAYTSPFPTYTDEKECALCKVHGLISDGSNYCVKCQRYLCLTCVQSHGTRCGDANHYVDENDVSNRKHAKDVQYCRSTRRLSNQIAKRDAFTGVNIHSTIAGSLNQNDVKVDQLTNNPNDQIKSTSKSTAVNQQSQEIASPRVSKSSDPEHVARCMNQFDNRFVDGTDVMYKGPERQITMPQSSREPKCSTVKINIKSGSKRPIFSGKGGIVTVGHQFNSPQRNPRFACSQHPTVNVENYCKEHDALCCEDCLISDHRSCTVQPIDEVAVGIRKNNHMKEILGEIMRVKGDCDNAVESLTRRVNCAHCHTEKKVHTSDVNELLKPNDLQRRLTKCENIQSNMNLCLCEISNAMETGTDMLTFVALKKNQPIIVSGRHELHSILSRDTEETDRCPHCQLKTSVPEIVSSKKDKEHKNQEASREGQSTFPKAPPAGEENSNTNDTVSGDSDTDKEESANITNGLKMKNSCADKETAPVGADFSSRPTSAKMGNAVAFDGKSTLDIRPAVKTTKQGKITTYGIVTDFYINEIKEGTESHGNPVLRLQSAPPERQNRKDSVQTKPVRLLTARLSDLKEKDAMVVWQNRKALEAVTTTTDKEGVNGLHKQTTPRSLTPREKRYAIQKLHKGRCTVPETPISNATPKTQRPGCTPDSIPSRAVTPDFTKKAPSVLKFVKTKEHNLGTNKCEVKPLIMRGASNIKAPHPERTKSAAIYRSPEQEFHYHSQQYAIRPRTKLVLNDQRIIRLPEDQRTCEVSGLACMPDGSIVVSDFSNKSIKLLRSGISKASVLCLDEAPHGVTAVSNATIVAINGIAIDHLLVISAGNDLIIRDRFKVGCLCKAVASYEGHVYLLCVCSYSTEVRILNTDGVVAIRMRLGHIVQTPSNIAVNPLTGVIYVTDKHLGVNAVTTGKVVERTTDSNLDGYYGVAVDINGNVFVCTQQPGGIHEVSYDGKLLMPVLLGYAVEDARELCYNKATNQLVVGCSQGETIQIYKLHDQLVLRQK